MIPILLTVFGLCVGSFLNVVILRMPQNKSIVLPSSYCFSCKTPLHWYHNIPILSWIFLRGKCSACKTKISIQYPLVEFFTALLFFYFSLTLPPLQATLVAITFACLFALSIIDYRYKAVPDGLSLPTLVFAIFSRPTLDGLLDTLIFAGSFALLRIFVSAFKKEESMGEADIIIAAIIGAMLGGVMGIFAIYLAAVFALFGFVLSGKLRASLPFIPFLSLGLFVTYVFQTPISSWIGAYFG